MANKNYNSTLQSNNTDLQAILNTINELPEAGGGAGGENSEDSKMLKGLIENTATEIVNTTATSVRKYGFYYSSVERVDLCVTKINAYAFYGSSLNTLILRHSAVVTLANGSNTLPYDSLWEEGEDLLYTLYVPSALINSYKTATNWSSFLNGYGWDVQPIEGSEYE